MPLMGGASRARPSSPIPALASDATTGPLAATASQYLKSAPYAVSAAAVGDVAGVVPVVEAVEVSPAGSGVVVPARAPPLTSAALSCTMRAFTPSIMKGMVHVLASLTKKGREGAGRSLPRCLRGGAGTRQHEPATLQWCDVPSKHARHRQLKVLANWSANALCVLHFGL